jgi:hypothetical protein
MESYGFDAKARYRQAIWNLVDRHCRRPRALRVCFYLETREALETQFLLARGYQAENLHAVNARPIEVALATKRLDALGLPRVQTHGVTLASVRDAPHRADVLHFDSTANLNERTLRAPLRAALIALRPRLIIVNMLAGRESNAAGWSDRVQEFDGPDLGPRTWNGKAARPTHLARVLWALSVVIDHGLELPYVTYGTYQSASGQPMVWGFATVEWRAHD